MVPPHGPVLRGVFQFIRGDKPAEDCLVGVLPAARELKVDALLPVFEQPLGDIHGQRVRVFGDIEDGRLQIVDEDRQLVVLIFEARLGVPGGHSHRRGTGGLIGRPAMAGAMSH